MSVVIKKVKAGVYRVRVDGVLIGRITSDGAYGQQPRDTVAWLTPDELDEINCTARTIGRESRRLNEEARKKRCSAPTANP